ncbi:SGNH/GDSL hydrolase family protein [Planctomycetes bacterium K23_9]|uniref:GDSL-like Lipase/Acylhydrolase n=1 Tax=Stieleria marina TaxID=1930275 RepID=A0A517NUR1_9BACT|nr:GDSL-like Lipase/Acylhydrolase [Planctomycetes bacterium K23_9]
MIRTHWLVVLLFFSCATARAQQPTHALELTLPPTIFASTDVPTNVYFDNIVLSQDLSKFRFEVVCDIGQTLPGNWSATPRNKDIGTHPIRVQISGIDGKLVASASSEIKVVGTAHGSAPKNASSSTAKDATDPIRLLIIGDSLTHGSAYPNEIARLFAEHSNVKIEMLGTHKPASAAKGVRHEGYGGWTWNNFVSKYEPRPDGKKVRSSPFVFLDKDSKPQLDMHRYFDQQCNGHLPDYVVILLGINDCFSAPADDATGVDAKIDKMLVYADQLLGSIRQAAPKAHIGFCLTTPPNAREEAFVANYQDRYSRWGWKRIQHRLVQRQLQFVDAKSDPQLTVVPTQLNIDPIDGYPTNNAVHPNRNGYKQLGATIYSWLSCKIAQQRWAYSPALLQPFWQTDVVQSEPVLFLRDDETQPAKGSVLFPISEIVSVQSSSGQTTYRQGRDYRFVAGTNQLVIPNGSRIVTTLASQLRRPDNSQRHKLTHRDGKGEILFGAQLEYHQLQTSVTYRKADDAWPVSMPTFDPAKLPVTISKLQQRKDLSIVVLGDSISTGCNASGWGDGAPFQPAYQDLLAEHLEKQTRAKIKLTNLSVGGKSTPWGMTMVPQVVSHAPDLVILAFGMNDSASRSAKEFGDNTAAIIKATRDELPQAEFVLVASMLGNRDWVRLKHDVFPEYRDQLASLCRPGIAIADMTSVWTEFLKRKKDSDLTGNGVNHPNDFAHRVYAQVIAALLTQ